MAVGLPVVATSLATEGMSLTDGGNILVADEAEEIAKAIAEVYKDEALWNQLSSNGLTFAQETWGADAAWNILAEILDSIKIYVQKNKHALTLYTEK